LPDNFLEILTISRIDQNLEALAQNLR